MTVLDAVTGDTLSTRCSITDSEGNRRYPPPGQSFYHSVDEGYFYSPGTFSIPMPDGETIFRIGLGFEYAVIVDTIDISGDSNIVIFLERLFDMESTGWYCGDVHSHLNHGVGSYIPDPSDAHLMARAEGLDVINCLDNEFHFTGGPDPCSTEDCIVYMSEEKRSGVFGHYGLLGLERLVEPYSADWGRLLAETADSVHSQQAAIVIAAHPVSSDDFFEIITWPGSGIARELPVDVMTGRVDAIEVMSYSNMDDGIETKLWYDILNCGFRLPACGGTDALLNQIAQYPPGGFRTYVLIEEGGFNYDSWIEGIREGRTFVTNGPLFTRFQVLGFNAGESLFLCRGSYKIPVEVTLESALPIDRVEIVRNGENVRTVYPTTDPCRIDTLVDIRVNESCWIAARAYGVNRSWLNVGDSLFAHTSAFYMDMEWTIHIDHDAATNLTDWLNALLQLISDRQDWPSEADSLAAVLYIEAGRDIFEYSAIITPADGPGGGSKIPEALQIRNYPNPFNSSTLIELEKMTADQAAYFTPGANGIKPLDGVLKIYDAAGRLVRGMNIELNHTGRTSVSWDGKDDRGRDAASGVYFLKIVSPAGEASRKILLMR